MNQPSDNPPDHPAGRRPEGTFPWAAALLIATIAGSAGIIVTVADHTTAWLEGMEGGRVNRTNMTSAAGVPAEAPAAPDSIFIAEAGDAQPMPESALSPQAPAHSRPAREAAPYRPAPESAPSSPAARADRVERPHVSPPRSAPAEKLVEEVALPDTPSPVPAPITGEETPEARPASTSPDSAAAAWERALPHLEGDAYRAARMRLAEARYRAWEADPTPEREASARAALRAYRAVAPEGPERDSVTQWMSHLDEAGFH